MAFYIHRSEDNTNKIEAYCDTVADLDALGTDFAPGSEATVLDGAIPLYALSPSKGWVHILDYGKEV